MRVFLLALALAGCGMVENACKEEVRSRLQADCRVNGCIVVPSGDKFMACYIPPLFFQTCDPKIASCQLSQLTCAEVP